MQKMLLKEELLRRRRNSPYYRLLVILGPLCLLLIGGFVWYRIATTDERLHEAFNRAEEMILQGDYENSLQLYQGIYSDHPEFVLAPRALYRFGEVNNLYTKRFHEALLAFLELEKDYADSEYVLPALEQEADIYKNRLNDYGRAVAVYQRLVDLDYQPVDRFQYELADCYFRQNNFEQARIEYENLLKSAPESDLVIEVRYRIGMAHALEGGLKEAEAVFRSLVKETPDSPFGIEARFGLASVLEEQERLRESLTELQALEGIYSKPEVLARKIAQVEDRIKKKKRAI